MTDKRRTREAARPASRGRAAGARKQTVGSTHCDVAGLWMREAARQTPSWLVSMVFHMIVLLILALWMMPEGMVDELGNLVMASFEEDPLAVLNPNFSQGSGYNALA